MSAAEVRATNVTASTEVAATAKVTASTSTEVTASTAVTAATTVAAATATASGQGGCGAENQRQQHNAYSTSSPHDIPPRQNPVGLIC
ncbi:MAG TPA: hypothetical protein VIC32_09895 [Terriglobales bacterium]